MTNIHSISYTLGSHKCGLYSTADPRFLIFQPIDIHDLEEMSAETNYLLAQGFQHFAIATFMVNDWMNELSPWDAPAAFGKVPFGHGAADTLRFLEQELMPDIREKLPSAETCLISGYSLAGLFALWASFNTTAFSGVAAASPSLWVQGWMPYARKNSCKAQVVYLSLGEKEPLTKNQMMARSGDCIKEQQQLLSPHLSCTLEWNEGGHFQDSGLRTAKGMSWVMRQLGER